MHVNVIGAGLAGVESAYFLANKGIKVRLFEMRPVKFTETHKTDKFGELVCSNTLGSFEITTGAGLLKKEMSLLKSLLIESAKRSFVKAGTALAVDRMLFSDFITNTIKRHENIEIIYEEVKYLDGNTLNIIATGPLTSYDFSNYLKSIINNEYLYFYDAIAPIVEASSVDFTKGFWGSRYDKGEDYFNCTMTKTEYDIFYNELLKAEKVLPKDFEKAKYFEGCLPIEEIAMRGYQSLVFGPMSPKGLKYHISQDTYAILQLRKESNNGELLSLVGFQTKLTYKEQIRVFRLIPCLRNAIFARLGSMHRNTFLQSNKLLKSTLELKSNPNIIFAGQITGVEGYSASAACGILAGINAWLKLKGKTPISPPKDTMLGALVHYISSKEGELQPVNPMFGLLEDIEYKDISKKHKRLLQAHRAIFSMHRWILKNGIY